MLSEAELDASADGVAGGELADRSGAGRVGECAQPQPVAGRPVVVEEARDQLARLEEIDLPVQVHIGPGRGLVVVGPRHAL